MSPDDSECATRIGSGLRQPTLQEILVQGKIGNNPSHRRNAGCLILGTWPPGRSSPGLWQMTEEQIMCWKKFDKASVALVAAILLVTATATRGASPSELLEKAIHAEETAGNIDEAIKLYEQVIAEGKAARNAAAQAEYRLAQCLLKKNKTAEANAELEKLVKDFPEEKDWVAKARKLLPS